MSLQFDEPVGRQIFLSVAYANPSSPIGRDRGGFYVEIRREGKPGRKVSELYDSFDTAWETLLRVNPKPKLCPFFVLVAEGVQAENPVYAPVRAFLQSNREGQS